jgi:hypothetical protein
LCLALGGLLLRFHHFPLRGVLVVVVMYPETTVDTVELEFLTRDDAADWIDANQLGRRNLTPDQFTLLLGRRYNRSKKTKAEAGAIGGASKAQSEPCLERLAAGHGGWPCVSQAAYCRGRGQTVGPRLNGGCRRSRFREAMRLNQREPHPPIGSGLRS